MRMLPAVSIPRGRRRETVLFPKSGPFGIEFCLRATQRGDLVAYFVVPLKSTSFWLKGF